MFSTLTAFLDHLSLPARALLVPALALVIGNGILATLGDLADGALRVWARCDPEIRARLDEVDKNNK